MNKTTREDIAQTLHDIREIRRYFREANLQYPKHLPKSVWYDDLTAFNSYLFEIATEMVFVYEDYIGHLKIHALTSAAAAIDLCCNFTMDQKKVRDIVQDIAAIGRAYRCGNGEISWVANLNLVAKACKRLLERCDGDGILS